MKLKHKIILLAMVALTACATQKKLPQAKSDILQAFVNDTVFRLAHVGVSVFDPADSSYRYDYQGEKFFVPASNTKILTCYAAMKNLKHILPGIKYYENDTAIFIIPTGDPTLLHRDYPNQPVIRFLQQQKKNIYVTGLIFKDTALGRGWSWDDYSDDYMVERSPLPVYGNTIRWVQEKIRSRDSGPQESVSVYSDPEVNWKLRFETDTTIIKGFHVQREISQNVFHVTEGNEDHAEQDVPFITNGIESALELLADTVGKQIRIAGRFKATGPNPQPIWSQPVDSVLRPMMYRSDNFFAEQLLEMVSAEKTGVMSDALAIDTILKTDLADLKQKPAWVDGSGLSRYNLFSPRIFTQVLDKMRMEFGIDRVRSIFPAGDSGTLKGYYNGEGPYLFAKSGSMSGVIALSGYLYTKKSTLLEFSVLVNNYKGNSKAIRRRIEKFLNDIR